MGSWSVLSVTGRHQELNTSIQFGTEWFVTFKLKYTASTFGAFVEPPKMAWDETIMFNDYVKNERWEFSGNFYTQKPDSPSMAVWAQRYFRAYLHAHNTPFQASNKKGHSKLFDLQGMPVKGAALGTHVGEAKQNKAVQDYLKSRGGILEIEVHDIPNMLKPVAGKEKRVERVLIFNCGVTGMGPRAAGWQHIKMDSTQPPTSWLYKFQMGGGAPGVKTTGLTKVPDPTPKGDLLPTGGIW